MISCDDRVRRWGTIERVTSTKTLGMAELNIFARQNAVNARRRRG